MYRTCSPSPERRDSSQSFYKQPFLGFLAPRRAPSLRDGEGVKFRPGTLEVTISFLWGGIASVLFLGYGGGIANFGLLPQKL